MAALVTVLALVATLGCDDGRDSLIGEPWENRPFKPAVGQERAAIGPLFHIYCGEGERWLRVVRLPDSDSLQYTHTMFKEGEAEWSRVFDFRLIGAAVSEAGNVVGFTDSQGVAQDHFTVVTLSDRGDIVRADRMQRRPSPYPGGPRWPRPNRIGVVPNSGLFFLELSNDGAGPDESGNDYVCVDGLTGRVVSVEDAAEEALGVRLIKFSHPLAMRLVAAHGIGVGAFVEERVRVGDWDEVGAPTLRVVAIGPSGKRILDWELELPDSRPEEWRRKDGDTILVNDPNRIFIRIPGSEGDVVGFMIKPSQGGQPPTILPNKNRRSVSELGPRWGRLVPKSYELLPCRCAADCNNEAEGLQEGLIPSVFAVDDDGRLGWIERARDSGAYELVVYSNEETKRIQVGDIEDVQRKQVPLLEHIDAHKWGVVSARPDRESCFSTIIDLDTGMASVGTCIDLTIVDDVSFFADSSFVAAGFEVLGDTRIAKVIYGGADDDVRWELVLDSNVRPGGAASILEVGIIDDEHVAVLHGPPFSVQVVKRESGLVERVIKLPQTLNGQVFWPVLLVTDGVGALAVAEVGRARRVAVVDRGSGRIRGTIGSATVAGAGVAAGGARVYIGRQGAVSVYNWNGDLVELLGHTRCFAAVSDFDHVLEDHLGRICFNDLETGDVFIVDRSSRECVTVRASLLLDSSDLRGAVVSVGPSGYVVLSGARVEMCLRFDPKGEHIGSGIAGGLEPFTPLKHVPGSENFWTCTSAVVAYIDEERQSLQLRELPGVYGEAPFVVDFDTASDGTVAVLDSRNRVHLFGVGEDDSDPALLDTWDVPPTFGPTKITYNGSVLVAYSRVGKWVVFEVDGGRFSKSSTIDPGMSGVLGGVPIALRSGKSSAGSIAILLSDSLSLLLCDLEF